MGGGNRREKKNNEQSRCLPNARTTFDSHLPHTCDQTKTRRFGKSTARKFLAFEQLQFFASTLREHTSHPSGYRHSFATLLNVNSIAKKGRIRIDNKGNNKNDTMGPIRRSKHKRRARYVLRPHLEHHLLRQLRFAQLAYEKEDASVLSVLTFSSDMDQIHEELRSTRKMEQFQALVPNDEKPGLGQFQCVECAVFHESEYALKHHQKGKKHKKRYVPLCGCWSQGPGVGMVC